MLAFGGAGCLLLLTLTLVCRCTLSHIEDQQENNPALKKSVEQKAKLETLESVVDDEGLTGEQQQEAGIDMTGDGEFRSEHKSSTPTDEKSGNFEIALQELFNQQSDNGEHTMTGEMLQKLEEEARKQAGKGTPNVIDTSAMLRPGRDSTPGAKSRRKRQVTKNVKRRWDGGIVPYTFNETPKAESEKGQKNIMDAMKYYEKMTCLRFPQWTASLQKKMNLAHNNRLKIGDFDGCWSYVGNLRGNGQHISCCGSVALYVIATLPCLVLIIRENRIDEAAGRGDSDSRMTSFEVIMPLKTGVALHEIGHALGMPHEQDREDRDSYVEQRPQNANPKYKNVFSGAPSKNYELFHPYDYGSRMHYGTHGFSFNGRPTLIVLDPDRRFLLGSRADQMSHYDLMAITMAYNCTDRCSTSEKRTKCENDGFLGYIDGKCTCKCVPGLTGDTCSDIYKPDTPPKQWPAGSYGLAMTDKGCPSGSWKTGSRYHVMDGGSSASQGAKLMSTYSRSYVQDHFCMLSSSATNQWGPGKYCIYQYTSGCPKGFTSGYINFNDEDSRGSTNNVTGAVPKGNYGKDTRYYYCCRNDGPTSVPLKLPTDKPFHLFRYDGACQQVEGMQVHEYYFNYDVERGSKASTVRPYYRNWWDNIFLYYCYYTKINYNCGGKLTIDSKRGSVTLTSPNYPKDYSNSSECTWLVKSESGTRIHLEFEDFDIQDTETHKCKDTLEIRDNLLGQPGPRYCGNNFKRSILSESNFVLLVLRSDQEVSRSGFKLKMTQIKENNMCYNPADGGATYRGNVNYTQYYEHCMAWEKVKHCKVNPFDLKYMGKGLEGNNNCRNPNDALRPWCYVNEHCDVNFCDVCGIERCYDKYDDCADLVASKPGFCSTDDGFSGCHKTCEMCGQGMADGGGPRSSLPTCSPPTPVDNEAKLVTSDSSKKRVTVGDSVTLECTRDKKRVTSSLQCLSDGTYHGQNPFCQLKCAAGWVRYRDSCYHVHTSTKFFAAARTTCTLYGANITSVHSEDENTFLFNLMKMSDLNSMYIGFNDENSVKKWKWIDGSDVTYTNWRKGQPSGGHEHCGVITSSGEWNDIYCKWHYPQAFVCKKKFTGSNTPCSDEREDCVQTITRNADICSRQPSYANRYCRATCGACGKEFTCKRPDSVTNAKLSKSGSEIKIGDYFEYTCNTGNALVSGNLKRACLPKGKLSGKPPICIEDESLPKRYGFRTISRGRTETSQKAILSKSNLTIFDRKGVVKSWSMYSKADSTIIMQVWRPKTRSNTERNHALVGENMVHLVGGRLNVITVPKFDRIEVQKGDVIGWYYPRGTVGLVYDDCNDEYAEYNVYSVNVERVSDFAEDASKSFSMIKRCRQYSVSALLEPGVVKPTINVASFKNGGRCQDASYNKASCSMAVDGQLSPYDGEWASDGGQGTWIKLGFSNSYTLVGARFMQRLAETGQNKKLKLEFSDGSSQEVTLTQRRGSSASDEHALSWDTIELQPVSASWVKVTVVTTYSINDNGFIEIEFYAGCPEGYTRLSDSCYRLHKSTSQSYESAVTVCQTEGAQIATIASKEENQIIAQLKTQQSVSDAYIGLTDTKSEGTWVWQDGSDSSYRNWAPNKPTAGKKDDCAVHGATGQWYDDSCRTKRAFVCKSSIKAGPTSDPDTHEMIGNKAVPMSHYDANRYITIEATPQMQIPFDGRVDAWKVYSAKNTTMIMQIWRQDKKSDGTFTLIGQNNVQLKAGKMNVVAVPEFEKIAVSKGDFIGWFYPATDVGARYTICSEKGVRIYQLYNRNGNTLLPKTELELKRLTHRPCRQYAIGAFINEDNVHIFPNVASYENGGRCVGASSNRGSCGRAVDGNLTAVGGWSASDPAQGVGAWISIKFNKKYRLTGARFLQRLSQLGQSKDLSLQFGDKSTQTVTLSRRTGKTSEDMEGWWWDSFSLKPVTTDSVKVSVTSAYSTNQNGFLEVEFYAECEEGWDRFDGSCFKYYSQKLTFLSAEEVCQASGAHISSVSSQQQNEYLRSLIKSSTMHIGYTDMWAEGKWAWLDSSPADVYQNWAKGQPDNKKGKEHCAQISSSSGQWNDAKCTVKQPFVCEVTYRGDATEDSEIPEGYYLSMDSITDGKVSGIGLQGNVNGATLTNGMYGKALSLSGTSQSVTLAESHRDECFGNLNLCDQGYTLSMWLRMDGASSKKKQFYVSNGGQEKSKSHGISLYRSSGQLVSIFRDTSRRWQVSANSNSAPENSWMCVALVWKRAEGLKLYVNGTMVAEDNDPDKVALKKNSFNQFTLGQKNTKGDFGRGVIDEFVFWPVAVDQDFVNNVCGVCPDGWTMRGNYCYQAHTAKKHYKAAENICTQDGAHISSVHDEKEADFLFNMGGNKTIWIGFDDRVKEGTFKWLDGSKVTYTNWGSKQPDNWQNHEDCAVMRTDKTWGDIYCEWHYPQPFICKKPRLNAKDLVE